MQVRYVGRDIGASLANLYLMQHALRMVARRKRGSPLAHHVAYEQERADIFRETAERLATK